MPRLRYLLPIVLLAYLATGVYQVGPDERGFRVRASLPLRARP